MDGTRETAERKWAERIATGIYGTDQFCPEYYRDDAVKFLARELREHRKAVLREAAASFDGDAHFEYTWDEVKTRLERLAEEEQ